MLQICNICRQSSNRTEISWVLRIDTGEEVVLILHDIVEVVRRVIDDVRVHLQHLDDVEGTEVRVIHSLLYPGLLPQVLLLLNAKMPLRN